VKTSAETFWAMKKGEHYSEILQQTISSFSVVGCNTSLKLHLDFFPKNLEASPINMAKYSIRMIPKLKRGTVENGVKM